MNDEARNLNDERIAASSFVLWMSDFFRHLNFDIRHFIA